MLKRHVSNWRSVLLVYSGVKKKTTVKFKDGTTTELKKNNYQEFYDTLYRNHLKVNGFGFMSDVHGRTIIQTPDGSQMVIPNNYSIAFDEIYLMQVYGKPDLKDKVVVDVGAAIGDTAIYFSNLGAKHVYAFETDEARCQLARENFSLNKLDDRIILFDHAATPEEINEMHADFIKIDCEGCEYELLPKIDLSGISELIMEYHSQPEPLIRILEEAGFKTNKDKEIIQASRPATTTLRKQ